MTFTKKPNVTSCFSPEIVPPVPQFLDFGFSNPRPLAPISVVSLLLNVNARKIMALIEEGKLRWAFDICSMNAGRREVRILAQSIFEFAGLCGRNREREANPEVEFLAVMDLILPRGAILSPANAHDLTTNTNGKPTAKIPPPAAVSIAKLLFPQEPVLRASEIGRCFGCHNQHIANLIHEKSFQMVNLRRGPKASPLVIRSSVVKFLAERRIT